VAAFPVMTNADLVRDPQIVHRGFVVVHDQPDVGWRGYPGCPIHFERSPVFVFPAPPLGGDNAAVLTGLLGYREEEIAGLYADHALFDHPVY
jgi:crotonobetainyl-CoA:carnitine CoA-transferase CaiB-like acyl-CoA transferase